MALTAALHGALLRGQRGKTETIVGTVLLENSSVKPYGKIVGKLILRTDSELKHFGMCQFTFNPNLNSDMFIAALLCKSCPGSTFIINSVGIQAKKSTYLRSHGWSSGSFCCWKLFSFIHMFFKKLWNCVGVRVQFEAVCNLQFETKFDSRVTFHKKQLSLIPKSMDTDSEGYQISPVMVEIIESRRNSYSFSGIITCFLAWHLFMKILLAYSCKSTKGIIFVLHCIFAFANAVRSNRKSQTRDSKDERKYESCPLYIY